MFVGVGAARVCDLFERARKAAPAIVFIDENYHRERNHQGKDNKLLTPLVENKGWKIHCHQRLGGLMKLYARAA